MTEWGIYMDEGLHNGHPGNKVSVALERRGHLVAAPRDRRNPRDRARDNPRSDRQSSKLRRAFNDGNASPNNSQEQSSLFRDSGVGRGKRSKSQARSVSEPPGVFGGSFEDFLLRTWSSADVFDGRINRAGGNQETERARAKIDVQRASGRVHKRRCCLTERSLCATRSISYSCPTRPKSENRFGFRTILAAAACRSAGSGPRAPDGHRCVANITTSGGASVNGNCNGHSCPERETPSKEREQRIRAAWIRPLPRLHLRKVAHSRESCITLWKPVVSSAGELTSLWPELLE